MALLSRTRPGLILCGVALKQTCICRLTPLYTHAPYHAEMIKYIKQSAVQISQHRTLTLDGKDEHCTSESLKGLDGKEYVHASDSATESIICNSMTVFQDFISPSEEENLFTEIEPYLKRLRYEVDHWDDAIHGYRETERRDWNSKNKATLQRVQDLAFPPGTPKMAYIHLLDLDKTGYIKPHIDSVRFCGSTIAGLSLLSSCVMRLVHEQNPTSTADILLNRRSLYIMKGAARYDYTHEVLKDELSMYRGRIIPRDRRISIMCRNEPTVTEPS